MFVFHIFLELYKCCTLRTNFLRCASLSIILFLSTLSLHAQSGIIDSSFGNNGNVVTKIASKTVDIAYAVAATPDNKIVVAGVSAVQNVNNNIAVVRYLATGATDKTFNGTGISIIKNGYANAVAVQPDKKVVVAGVVQVKYNSTIITALAVWRLKVNGSLDSSFGNNGFTKISINASSSTCYTVALQPDGKILVGGATSPYGTGKSYLVVARLNPNGNVDMSFATFGKFEQTLNPGNLTCEKILLQPDGKIIAAGQYDSIYNFDTHVYYMFALRLQTNGTPDLMFGENGRRRYGTNVNGDYCYSAGLLPDSRFVLGGSSSLANGKNPASVVCVKNDGTVDKSFGRNGWQYVDFGGSFSTTNTVLIQNNGKIILAGITYSASNFGSAFLSRFNTNGSLDASFAVNGKDTFYTENKSYNNIVTYSACLQNDDKILITGDQFLPNTNLTEYFTARFLNNQLAVFAKTSNTTAKTVNALDDLKIYI